MNRSPDRVPVFSNHPLWRYGFLAVIAGLYIMAYRTARTFPVMLGPASLNFVVATMLLVNHVVTAFLTPVQQGRVRRLQFGFLAACCLYVVVYIVGDRNQWFKM